MFTIGKHRNYGINCRCGKRTVWKVPEDLALAVMNDSPVTVTVHTTKPDESGTTMYMIPGLYFHCECGRGFHLTSEGLHSTEGERATDIMRENLGSKMVN